MKKLILGVALSVAMIGCANYTGDTDVYEGSYVGGDSTVTDSSTNYICQSNTDTQCYTPSYDGYVDENGDFNDVADEPTGDYDASYSPAECAANGYFYCSIENKCLNIPASGGTCNR